MLKVIVFLSVFLSVTAQAYSRFEIETSIDDDGFISSAESFESIQAARLDAKLKANAMCSTSGQYIAEQTSAFKDEVNFRKVCRMKWPNPYSDCREITYFKATANFQCINL